MKKLLHKTCPHCQNPFEATRKNQDYCSDDCRIDANNARAKERYAQFKLEGSQLVALQQQVNQFQQDQQVTESSRVAQLQQQVEKLQQQVRQFQQERANLTVVITVDKPINDTLTFGGRRYKRSAKGSKPRGGVSLDKGGALLMPGNTILYRTESHSIDNYYEYVQE